MSEFFKELLQERLSAQCVCDEKKPRKVRCHLLCDILQSIVILRRHRTVNNAQNFLPQRTDVVTTRCAREIVCK